MADDPNERMQVLRMLDEGKISPEEAISLLKAMREAGPAGGGAPPGAFPFGFRFGGEAVGERAERAARRAAERARRAAEYWSQHAEDIAERAGRAAEQVGEGMGRVLAGFPDILDRMSRAGWGNWGPGYRFESVVEGALAADGDGSLDLEGWNGSVSVHPVDGDRARLVLRKTVHAPTEDAAASIAQGLVAEVDAAGRAVRVGRPANGGVWPGGLSVEAYVPRGVDWGGQVRTGNGSVQLDRMRVRGLRLQTTNGSIRLDGCEGSDVGARTSNGRIEVTGALAGRLELQTSNGAIEVAAAPPQGESSVEAVTSNGPIGIRLPAGTAVDLDASTTNGRFDLSGLGALGPDTAAQKGFGRNDVQWRSPEWEQSPSRLRLHLRTSNGPVRVS